MAEPTSTAVAVATLSASGSSIAMLTILGVPLGLQINFLVAGFSGSLVAIILLNTVPSVGDTWQHMIRSTLRRMFVAIASSLTAGYLTPLAALIASVPEPLIVGAAFGVGAGAQQVLSFVIRRLSGVKE